jgi:hypothetical protein
MPFDSQKRGAQLPLDYQKQGIQTIHHHKAVLLNHHQKKWCEALSHPSGVR